MCARRRFILLCFTQLRLTSHNTDIQKLHCSEQLLDVRLRVIR